MLLMFYNFNINNVQLIPDAAGWLLILIGLAQLQSERPAFKTALLCGLPLLLSSTADWLLFFFSSDFSYPLPIRIILTGLHILFYFFLGKGIYELLEQQQRNTQKAKLIFLGFGMKIATLAWGWIAHIPLFVSLLLIPALMVAFAISSMAIQVFLIVCIFVAWNVLRQNEKMAADVGADDSVRPSL